MELDKAAHMLRLRYVEGKKDQDLGEVIIPPLAERLGLEAQELGKEIESMYRVNSNFARKQRIRRDIRIKFVKRSTKDKILKLTNDKPLVILGKEVIVLKEIPKSIRKIRNQYCFLTDKLNQCNIKFKWLIPEGILVNWKSKNIKLETVEEAENFDRQHLRKEQQEGEHLSDENSSQSIRKNSQEHNLLINIENQEDPTEFEIITGTRRKTR
ncbi:hypothetical protein JRQ81_005300 [Phrynocephalus forsythii]|uniref:Uncharacterized protein n=1 Tax=Phrynocephalus forsythii TaxID=171643 RepID=A0A9Q0XIB1_9SAUR|nr:hypothetical protein JRQ81_005300 [Phrynocephalus forsythii]